MILTPHMLAGAAVGSKISKTRWIFLLIILSLLSHYFLDAIPHSEYDVSALANGFNIAFIIAGLKVSLDILAGFFIIFFLGRSRKNLPYILAGAFIALLPDFAIFLSWQFNHSEILDAIVAFGHKVHYPEKQFSLILGFGSQIALSLLAIFLLTKTGKRTKN